MAELGTRNFRSSLLRYQSIKIKEIIYNNIDLPSGRDKY